MRNMHRHQGYVLNHVTAYDDAGEVAPVLFEDGMVHQYHVFLVTIKASWPAHYKVTVPQMYEAILLALQARFSEIHLVQSNVAVTADTRTRSAEFQIMFMPKQEPRP